MACRKTLFRDWPTLIAGVQPGGGNGAPILMSLGEPQHPIPAFIGDILNARLNDYGKYPPIQGSDKFRDGGGPLAEPALWAEHAIR